MSSKTKKKAHPPRQKKATLRDWIAGARVRTLPLAIAPVAIGSGAAAVAESFDPALAMLCLVVALSLQIGVNYANDYSDGIRGTDEYRKGPSRLTGSGAAQPKKVLAAALIFFALAVGAGIAIVVLTQLWWIIAVGAACLIAAWFYTGGKKPYGYAGFGELAVFVFFGLVATLGTMYVQAGFINGEALLGATAIGFLACAVLIVNNIRDIDTDIQAGKKTLSVRIGRLPSAILFCIFMLAPFAITIYFALFFAQAWVVFFGLLIALPACLITVTAKTPAEYILALKLASATALFYGLSLAWVFFL